MSRVNAIEGAKHLIDLHLQKGLPRSLFSNDFEGFNKGYLITNENIKAYLDLISFTNKKSAVSVLSGGDHPFSLVSKGIMDIDTFDINGLQQYIALGLKRAMILKYSYEEFLDVIEILTQPWTFLEDLTSIIMDLLDYMEKEERDFWREVIDYNYKKQKANPNSLSIISILTETSLYSLTKYSKNVPYLESREKYDYLRSNLAKATIRFKQVNACDLSETFKSKHDIILLSNVLDYMEKYWGLGWNYEKLAEYRKSLEEITHEDGIIYLNYLYAERSGEKALFRRSSVTKEDLVDEEIINFKDARNNTAGIIRARVR